MWEEKQRGSYVVSRGIGEAEEEKAVDVARHLH
jgi:hypothetical protein